MGRYDEINDVWWFAFRCCGQDTEIDDRDTHEKGILICAHCDAEFFYDKTRTEVLDALPRKWIDGRHVYSTEEESEADHDSDSDGEGEDDWDDQYY